LSYDSIQESLIVREPDNPPKVYFARSDEYDIVYADSMTYPSLEQINEYLMRREVRGVLSDVCILLSDVREGCYVVVDYSGIEKEVLYYERSIGFVETNIGGRRDLFSIKEVSLSQGDFLGVFSASSMGNGCFYLYNNNDDCDLAYALEDVLVVDLHMDFRPYEELSQSVQNQLSQIGIEGGIVSWIYANGRLEVIFDDYNFDGYTDIRFYGIRQTCVSPDDGHEFSVIAEEIYVCTFLFRPELNDFSLEQELLIPLSLN